MPQPRWRAALARMRPCDAIIGVRNPTYTHSIASDPRVTMKSPKMITVRRLLLLSALALAFAGIVPVQAERSHANVDNNSEAKTWIVDRSDNICGLEDPKMLSKPAKVDYDVLLKATSEMKRMRDEKIDPNSSAGIQLRQAAADRVRNAADRVRQSQGYCSVWKSISHQDGRVIPDVTDLVKAQL